MVFTRLSRLDPNDRAALAVLNGYETEAFIEIDKIESVRGYSTKHLIQADAVLEWWRQYSEDRGIPIHQTLYPRMPVPEREHFKDFLRYYIATHSGLLRDTETGTRHKSPSTRTLLKQASRWYFGFEKSTGTKVGEEFKAEIRLTTPKHRMLIFITTILLIAQTFCKASIVQTRTITQPDQSLGVTEVEIEVDIEPTCNGVDAPGSATGIDSFAAGSADLGVAAHVCVASPAAVETHQVQVGAQGKLVFSPNQLDAAINDVIEFQFLKLNHTLTQSSLEQPCVAAEGGFDTGFSHFNPENQTDDVLRVTVSHEGPQWFYCRQTLPQSHCEAGMVFGLNPAGKMDKFIHNIPSNPVNTALGTVGSNIMFPTNTAGSLSPTGTGGAYPELPPGLTSVPAGVFYTGLPGPQSGVPALGTGIFGTGIFGTEKSRVRSGGQSIPSEFLSAGQVVEVGLGVLVYGLLSSVFVLCLQLL